MERHSETSKRSSSEEEMTKEKKYQRITSDTILFLKEKIELDKESKREE